MKNKLPLSIFLQFFFIFIFSTPTFFVHAQNYQQISLGETIRLGEFVYNDDYTASTTPCTVTIFDSAGASKIASGSMTADANGWHYYDYAVGGGEALGNWPTSMSCGSSAGGDLIIVDKTFTVIPTSITTNSDIANSVWNASSRTLTSFGTLGSDVTAIKNKTDTILWTDIDTIKSNVATLITEVGTGNITGIKTKTDSITWGDITGLVTSTGDIKTKTDTIAWSDVSGIKTATDTIDWSDVTAIKVKTDTIVWGDVSTIKTNVATLITEVGTGNISGIKTKTDTIDWSDVTGIVTSTGDIQAKTDTIAWGDVSAIKTKTDTIDWNDVTGIKTKTDTIVWGDITGLISTASDIKTKTDTIVWADISSLPANIWAYSGRTLTSFGTLVADVWSNATRTLSSFGSVGTDLADIKTKTDTIVWGDVSNIKTNVASLVSEIGTGNISGIKTKTDTIDWSDVTGIVTSTGDIQAKTDTIAWGDVTDIKTKTDTIDWNDVTGIKTKTDTIVWGDITTVKTNIATLITEVGTGNISGIKTKTDTIDWSDVTGIVTSIGDIQAKTDTIAWGDVSAIKTKTDTIDWSDVTGIETKTNTIVWSDVTGLVSTAVAIKTKTDTIDWSDITALPSNVWTVVTRTLTSTSSSTYWSLRMSDFSSINAGDTYRATVTTVFDGTLTDSLTTPTITLYDSNRNVVVSGVSMTHASTGTYTYSYVTSSGATGGVWESAVSANVDTGKDLFATDYWNITSAPAQVLISSMGTLIVPNITANARITNEGSVAYEYQYEWCVVSSLGNPCGGGDDVYYASAAKLIQPGADFDTVLSATVSTAGSYYFKVVAYFDTESSGASRSFTATTASTGGGGGGGGGTVSTPPTNPGNTGGSCSGADFNLDTKVSSIDFSILLSFWKTNPPFTNPCVDINNDAKVNSVDFSILLSQWGR